MKRVLLGLAAVVLLGVAVAWSGPKTARPEFDFTMEKRNPVTHLRVNNDPANFQFAIVSDRTGGHRARIFSRAVEQLNLLQPEFVVSVGDLIEGYTENKEQVTKEWREFQTYASRLQMPFFYVPGNHDFTNKMMAGMWKEKFGRSYYEFVYRDVLFLALNSEDPPGNNPGQISAEQVAWLEKVLQDNRGVRWTLVFLHKPIWTAANLEKNGWQAVEKLLAGRPYTVFAGHVHRYQKYVRQGQNYYTLATTGGISRLRGVEYGEFDHIVWVTMKKEGPTIANLMMDGILREDLSGIPSEEEGMTMLYRRPIYPVQMKVLIDGRPAVGAYVVISGTGKEARQPRADGIVEADGVLRPSTYAAFDGLAAGTHAITVELRKPRYLPDGRRGPNLLPPRYADVKSSGLTFTVKPGATNALVLELTSK